MEERMTVLLTGGSSGIGAATARELALRGMKVYAASRRGTFEADVQGVVPVKLDVNDAAMARELVKEIVEKEGHLDAVVCNAGNGIYGPVEGTLESEARYQFETNYFGALNTINACLPVFRSQGHGRIITVTSVMAVLQLPFQGFYSSAKAALLSISESLAMELKGSGIQCCAILPGDVATGFTQARRQNEAALDPQSPYRSKMERNLAIIERDEQNGMAPEAIARAIASQLCRRRMAVRVVPGLQYKAVAVLARILPESWKQFIIGKIY